MWKGTEWEEYLKETVDSLLGRLRNEEELRCKSALKEMGVDVAIPLFEETVEWAGAVNAVLLGNPRLMNQAMGCDERQSLFLAPGTPLPPSSP